MTDFKVTAPHQVEREGRFFSPNQLIPGFDPEENEDDLTLLSHGLVGEVEKGDAVTAEPEPEPETSTEPVEEEKPSPAKKTSGAKASSDDKNKEQK